MIDHVLGRPSIRFRKYQVFTVVLLWSIFLSTTDKHGPFRPIRRISHYLSRKLTFWRALIFYSLGLYVSRNFARVVGLESPEPLANLYTREYFRATWVTTALDAGFWTAMHLKPIWFRDISSIIFSVYYLFCAEQADEMVRRVRGQITLQHLRVSWNKPRNPYLFHLTKALRHKSGIMRSSPIPISIPRPPQSSYKEPISAWLYYDQPHSTLTSPDLNKLILDIPGGGFVAMDPRCHEDKLLAWAGRTKLPIISLDYGKAPEKPYPYALNECYDAYHTLIQTKGACIGMSGSKVPKIVLTGDSAGGNLGMGMVLMLLQDSADGMGAGIPLPEAVVAIYPALDMNMRNWMTDEQMSLIRQREVRQTNKGVISRKSEDYKKMTPNTPYGSEDESEETVKPVRQGRRELKITTSGAAGERTRTKTRLAMTSMISYTNDRILTAEMLRAMLILYIGPHNRPDFATDCLLSPLLAPEQLLMRFPKVYFLTGERDPLVDDTVVFAGRLRQAKRLEFKNRQELGLIPDSAEFDDSKHVVTKLVPGISHGFMQFVSLFPSGWQYIFQCDRWIRDAFYESDEREKGANSVQQTPMTAFTSASIEGEDYFSHIHRSSNGPRGKSQANEEGPLEMAASTSSISGSGVGRGKNRVQKGNRHHARRRSGTTSPTTSRKGGTLSQLSSSDDLVGRRMVGLTHGLMTSGTDEDDQPKTPS